MAKKKNTEKKTASFVVNAGDERRYEFIVPEQAPVFECFDATITFLSNIIESAKSHASKTQESSTQESSTQESSAPVPSAQESSVDGEPELTDTNVADTNVADAGVDNK